jgi:hypothetical protein
MGLNSFAGICFGIKLNYLLDSRLSIDLGREKVYQTMGMISLAKLFVLGSR